VDAIRFSRNAYLVGTTRQSFDLDLLARLKSRAASADVRPAESVRNGRLMEQLAYVAYGLYLVLILAGDGRPSLPESGARCWPYPDPVPGWPDVLLMAAPSWP
jgi:hypothetical protein